jgi:hypothetical protein
MGDERRIEECHRRVGEEQEAGEPPSGTRFSFKGPKGPDLFDKSGRVHGRLD